MTISNFVCCSIGNSPGLAPFNILSTKIAAGCEAALVPPPLPLDGQTQREKVVNMIQTAPRDWH
jgi:hypothetical protein